MSSGPALPPWAAVTVAVLLLLGSLFTLTGALGLLRFRTFYQRVHAPTLGTSFGVAGITLANVVCFSAVRSGIALGALVLFLLVTLTVPVGLMLLVRAALFRDRVEGNPDVPPALHETHSP
jgi:multicomponent K+:H+ antiporter subunit G